MTDEMHPPIKPDVFLTVMEKINELKNKTVSSEAVMFLMLAVAEAVAVYEVEEDITEWTPEWFLDRVHKWQINAYKQVPAASSQGEAEILYQQMAGMVAEYRLAFQERAGGNSGNES